MRRRYIYIIRRGQIVKVGRTKKTITISNQFEYPFTLYNSVKLKIRRAIAILLLLIKIFIAICLGGIVVILRLIILLSWWIRCCGRGSMLCRSCFCYWGSLCLLCRKGRICLLTLFFSEIISFLILIICILILGIFPFIFLICILRLFASRLRRSSILIFQGYRIFLGLSIFFVFLFFRTYLLGLYRSIGGSFFFFSIVFIFFALRRLFGRFSLFLAPSCRLYLFLRCYNGRVLCLEINNTIDKLFFFERFKLFHS